MSSSKIPAIFAVFVILFGISALAYVSVNSEMKSRSEKRKMLIESGQMIAPIPKEDRILERAGQTYPYVLTHKFELDSFFVIDGDTSFTGHIGYVDIMVLPMRELRRIHLPQDPKSWEFYERFLPWWRYIMDQNVGDTLNVKIP